MNICTTGRNVWPLAMLTLCAGLLLAACNGTSWAEDEEAERQIQRIVFPLTGEVKVEVMESTGGVRRVDLTVVGGLADSLDLDALRTSSVVNNRTQSVLDALQADYDAFSSIERLEIHFIKRAQLGVASASTGRVFRFDEAELDAM